MRGTFYEKAPAGGIEDASPQGTLALWQQGKRATRGSYFCPTATAPAGRGLALKARKPAQPKKKSPLYPNSTKNGFIFFKNKIGVSA